MMKHLYFFSMILLSISAAFSQSVQLLTQGTKSSFRGLSVPDDSTVWVSGSNGTVGKSTDGGKSWQFMIVRGFEKTDFRDIEAFDDKTAVIMGIDSPAYILRTTDGGNHWKICFKDHTSGMFLDAMDIREDGRGIVIGDPLRYRFFIARTTNYGKKWKPVRLSSRPPAMAGEAFFAASGSNAIMRARKKYVFVSGGNASRFFNGSYNLKLPIVQGKSSAGANSIAIGKGLMAVAGGDFENKDSSFSNFVMSNDDGRSWHHPSIPPGGYRSCVSYVYESCFITCGLNGVDISFDNCDTFRNICGTGYHVCKKSKKGNTVFLAGGNGRIGKLIL